MTTRRYRPPRPAPKHPSTLNLRMSYELRDALDDRAEAEGMTVSDLARALLTGGLAATAKLRDAEARVRGA